MSSSIANMYKGKDYGAKVIDPITKALIHMTGAIFVDYTDLYCWIDSMLTGEEVFDQIQMETMQWGRLLIATGGCLKLEQCF